ncbi:MAG: type II toxin-antitoxin system RelB/DinJ family antitoxin [Selenomonadaceae bacterium]|nr:type II toxin-antitoxin system RelB/DinJ family antitoxin [Selenomonadaceae bacterium]
MAATVNVSIRLDRELKERADEFFKEVGMNFSTAVNVFLRQTLRLGKIPFNIAVDRPNEETIAALLEGERLAYDTSVKGYTSAEELFAELNAEMEQENGY